MLSAPLHSVIPNISLNTKTNVNGKNLSGNIDLGIFD